MNEDKGSKPPRRSGRWSSIVLAVGVLVLPFVFVWFLLRRRYPPAAQALGCAWMGLVGAGLLLTAPGGPWATVSPQVEVSAAAKPPPPPMITEVAADARLDLDLGATEATDRLLRTRATLTNRTDAVLKYAQVSCLFYSEEDALLGSGLGNWAAVEAGKTVSGDVIASSIDLAQVRRRACKAIGR